MLRLREANANDVAIVEYILSTSRSEFLPYAKSPHSKDEIRQWISAILMPSSRVVIVKQDGEDVGVLATSVTEGVGWIDQLYLLPGYVGRGIGTVLLKHALKRLPRPVCLWTFQQNQPAIHFYEHHGFKAVKYTNGENNEESCPDVLYELN